MSQEDWKFAVVALSAVFFVIDPLANVPIFLTITRTDTPEQRVRIAGRAALAAWMLLSVFAAAGGLIFKAFGISLGAFKIAGGLMLLLMSIDMMRATTSRTRTTTEEQDESREREDVAIFPLAIPMLAGPGAITTAIVLIGHAHDWPKRLIFFAAIPVVMALTYATLLVAARGARQISPTILNIITRLMGLLLAAIGVQFILTALKLS